MIAASIGDGAGSRNWSHSINEARLREAVQPVVLFVEDQPMVRFTITAQLMDAGYKVLQATTGAEALAMLEAGAKFDALLTDLRLPGSIDGWDIAEVARRLRPNLPVIYASAYSYVTPRQVPGSVMLDKPYPPQALLDALEALLD